MPVALVNPGGHSSMVLQAVHQRSVTLNIRRGIDVAMDQLRFGPALPACSAARSPPGHEPSDCLNQWFLLLDSVCFTSDPENRRKGTTLHTSISVPQQEQENAREGRQIWLHHVNLQKLLIVLRAFIFVTLLFRYAVFGSSTQIPDWAMSMEAPVLSAIGIVYLSMIVISAALLSHNPLVALNPAFHEWQAYLEIVVLCIAIAFTGNIGTHLMLLFFVPLFVLTRVRVRSRLYIAAVSMGFVLTTVFGLYLFGQNSFELTLANSLYGAALDFVIITAVTYVVSSNWETTRPRIVEANVKYALRWLEEQSAAKVLHVRIFVHEDRQESLVLVSSVPDRHMKHKHAFNYTRLNVREKNSIVSQAYRSGEMQLIVGKEQLATNLFYTGVLHPYDLESGAAIPLCGRESVAGCVGVLSAYWPERIGDNRVRDMCRHVEQLANYIQIERRPAQEWATDIATLHIRFAEASRLNRWFEKIQDNVDFWETADLIVEAACDLSEFETALVFFWDADTRMYRLHAPYGIRGADDLPDLAQLQIDASIPFNRNRFAPIEMNEHPVLGAMYEDVFAFPLHTIDKTIGLLVIAGKATRRTSIGTQEILANLARHGSVDLRNCQLLYKAETNANVSEALRKMIHELFSPREISGDDRDLYRGIARILRDAVESYSCSFGLLRKGEYALDSGTFITTDEHVRGKVDINCPVTSDIVRRTMESRRKVLKSDFTDLIATNDYVRQSNVNISYTVCIDLNEEQRAILFINYLSDLPQTDYRIRQVTPLAQEHVPEAWKAWKAWDQAQKYQRQTWKFDIHDQLNELQFNVALPLERLLIKGKLSPDMERDVRHIHRNARSVSTTLQHIMDDMRHPAIVEEGFCAALTRLMAQYDGLTVAIVLNSGEPPGQVVNPIYRLAREAIHNGFKHGGAHVDVSVRVQKHALHMEIKDDGDGFDGVASDGSGIELMNYQANLVDAKLNWTPRRDTHGTCVKIEWYNTTD